MKRATAQARLFDVPDPPHASAPSPPAAARAVADDGLPPPTKAHAFYWAQLCGELRLRGAAGIADMDGWSADLRPSEATLRALVERDLVARRDRAWKLRRGWYGRLQDLKARAVDTPPLAPAERPAPGLPTYAELEAWEAACRWLDAQPARRARLPFLGLAPPLRAARDEGTPAGASEVPAVLSGPRAADGALVALVALAGREREEAERAAGGHAALLKDMRKYRLVRHTGRCEWALSPHWRERLLDLHAGVERAAREPGQGPAPAPPAARSLCAGLDTWALNWLVEEPALPARLRRELDDHQEAARAREGEVETGWVYDGVPLRMYQAGVRAKGGGDGTKAKGVSWSYILVNPSLRLLVRRTALGGVAANARLGSECLWRRTPRAALDELHALVRRLWGRDKGRWQVSYAHLAHDVADAPLEREQLDRYVSRSRRQASYDASRAELERLRREARPRAIAGAALDDLDDPGWDGPPLEEALYDWEAEYGEDEELLLADPFAEEEGYAWERTPKAVKQARAELEAGADRRAVTAYRWGKRLSGVAFSPGGAVSFVLYRKDWEGRLRNKRHMEPLWRAAGWDGVAPVTRHEARLIREPLRELRDVTCPDRALLDDPWRFLEEVPHVWGRMVGRPDACPDAVDVAWVRRVVPREGESNRSRWDTDPAWRVVQAADFSPAPPAARRLVRRAQQRHDVRAVDSALLGLFKRREALTRPDPAGRDLSLAMRDAVLALGRELQARGEQFDEAVRRKRQDCGLPVPLAGRVLPLRPREADEGGAEAVRALAWDLERTWEREAAQEVARDPGLPGRGRVADGCPSPGRQVTYASLRARSAELRMREAFTALEAAELAGVPLRELERIERDFARATAAFDATRTLVD